MFDEVCMMYRQILLMEFSIYVDNIGRTTKRDNETESSSLQGHFFTAKTTLQIVSFIFELGFSINIAISQTHFRVK